MSQGGFQDIFAFLGIFGGLVREYPVPVDVVAETVVIGRTVVEPFVVARVFLDEFQIERVFQPGLDL